MKTKTELTNIAAITSTEVMGVSATFSSGTGAKTYLYKCPRWLGETLKKGDLVLVEYFNANQADRPVTAVITHEIHDAFDPEKMDIDYAWVIQKIDTTYRDELLRWEADTVTTLSVNQRQRARKAVLEEMGVADLKRPTLPAPDRIASDIEDATVIE